MSSGFHIHDLLSESYIFSLEIEYNLLSSTNENHTSQKDDTWL